MEPLIFIVEDDFSVIKVLTRLLDASGISYLFASNLKDAMELFKHNKKFITYVALDGNLDANSNEEYPDTSSLAEIIAGSSDFKGRVFVMSLDPTHNDTLMYVIGNKCESLVDFGVSIKPNTIKEIIRRIKEKT